MYSSSTQKFLPIFFKIAKYFKMEMPAVSFLLLEPFMYMYMYYQAIRVSHNMILLATNTEFTLDVVSALFLIHQTILFE